MMFANLGTLTGVRFPGLTHPGIIGTAPSKELLQIWNDRERELEETGPQALKLCEVLHSRPLANLPSTKGCVLGKVRSTHAGKEPKGTSFILACFFPGGC